MNKSLRLSSPVALLWLLLGATANCHAQSTAVESETRVLANIPYKADAATEYERERCKFDLYLPSDAQDFATIIWFHGGGLQNGHKADDIAVGLARRFAGEGIAVASINYRLSPKAKYPAYVEDAAAAVAFVQKNITERGGDSKRVFVSGHSAGGYLTSMVGIAPEYLQAHGLTPNDLAGFIPVSGQAVTHSTVRGERGIPRGRPVIDEAAPAFHVSEAAPPFLCVVGSNDLPARAEENRYFVAALQATGHRQNTYLEVEGRDHGTIASLMPEPDDEVARAILRFVGDLVASIPEP